MSEWFWDGSSCLCFYWYHFCFDILQELYLYCKVFILYYIILYYIALHCITLYYITWYHIISHIIISYIISCIILYYISYRIILYHILYHISCIISYHVSYISYISHHIYHIIYYIAKLCYIIIVMLQWYIWSLVKMYKPTFEITVEDCSLFRAETCCVLKNCAVVGYYAASNGNFLPTFTRQPIGPIFRGQESKSRNFGKKLPLLAAL